MRRTLLIIAALAYLASTFFVGFFTFISGAFGCYESCPERGGHWWDQSDSWQWDAIALLGPIGALAGATALVLALSAARRPVVPWTALAAHATVLGVSAAFLWPTYEIDASEVVPWLVATLGSGAGLVYLSVSRHAGERARSR